MGKKTNFPIHKNIRITLEVAESMKEIKKEHPLLFKTDSDIIRASVYLFYNYLKTGKLHHIKNRVQR